MADWFFLLLWSPSYEPFDVAEVNSITTYRQISSLFGDYCIWVFDVRGMGVEVGRTDNDDHWEHGLRDKDLGLR